MGVISSKQIEGIANCINQGITDASQIKETVKYYGNTSFISKIVQAISGINCKEIENQKKNLSKKMAEADRIIEEDKQNEKDYKEAVSNAKNNISQNFGLWANGNGYLISKYFKNYDCQAFLEKNFPYGFRVVARINKGHQKGDKRPYIQFWLTNCSKDNLRYNECEYKFEVEKLDSDDEHEEDKPYIDEYGHYYDECGNRLFTKSEVRTVMNGVWEDRNLFYDPYDYLISDYINY